MKKAQGLSLRTIVIAVIVLIVLLVLIVIFGGRIGVFTSGVKNCKASGGDGCATDCETLIDPSNNLYPGALFVTIPGTECDADKESDEKCCKAIYRGRAIAQPPQTP